MAEHVLRHIKANYREQLNSHPVLQQIARKPEDKSALLDDTIMAEECKAMYVDILEQQRQWLFKKNKEEVNLDEDLIRKHLRQIDLEKEKLLYM